MQRSQTVTSSGPDAVWVIGMSGSLARIRHIQARIRRNRAEGNPANEGIGRAVLEGLGQEARPEVADVEKDDVVQGSGADEKGSDSLPFPYGNRWQ